VLPLKADVVGLVVNEVDVAPGITPPSTDRRRVDEPVNDHCTMAYPVALAVKVAAAGAVTDTDMGWRVIVGATSESYHTARPAPLLKFGSATRTVAASLEMASELAASEIVAIMEPVVAEWMVVDEKSLEMATIDPSGVMATVRRYPPLMVAWVMTDSEPIALTNEKMGEVD